MGGGAVGAGVRKAGGGGGCLMAAPAGGQPRHMAPKRGREGTWTKPGGLKGGGGYSDLLFTVTISNAALFRSESSQRVFGLGTSGLARPSSLQASGLALACLESNLNLARQK